MRAAGLTCLLVCGFCCVVLAQDEEFSSIEDAGKEEKGGIRKMYEVVQEDLIMGFDQQAELVAEIQRSRQGDSDEDEGVEILSQQPVGQDPEAAAQLNASAQNDTLTR